MYRIVAAIVLIVISGCATSTNDDPLPAPPPWSGPPVASSSVPPVLLTQWSKADNRQTCSPLWVDDRSLVAGGTARAATFSGGWGVAVDLPSGPGTARDGRRCDDCGRSAWGIAGAGIDVDGGEFAQWTHQVRWSDGSRAGWGLEGGSGPRHLAYLEVAGERCLYNVWSSRGESHLESIVRSLRRVAGE